VGGRLLIAGSGCLDVALPLGVDCRKVCPGSGSATKICEKNVIVAFSRPPTSEIELFAIAQEVGGRLSVAGCCCLDVALPLGIDCRKVCPGSGSATNW